MNKVISRIGVTPVGSGRYRINRLRSHLLAYIVTCSAKADGYSAKFFVRCDDTNYKNTDRKFLDDYLRTLFKIGVNPDMTPYEVDGSGHMMFQSQRSELYKEKVEQLMKEGFAYRETDGAVFFNVRNYVELCKSLLCNDKLIVHDVAMGVFAVDVRSADKTTGILKYRSFPIQRSDGSFLFNLCSPVDDAQMGITHVVRDRNKLNVLSMQEMVRTALRLPSVVYLHIPPIVNDAGKRYTYDDMYGDGTYESFLEAGYTSKAIISYLLASIEGPPEIYYSDIDKFVSIFDIKKIHQAHTRFSREVLMIHQIESIKEMDDVTYKKAFEERLAIVNPKLFLKYKNEQNLQKLLLIRRGNLVDLNNFSFDSFGENFEAIDCDLLMIAKKVEKIITSNSLILSKDSIINSFGIFKEYLNIDKQKYYMSLRVIFTGKTYGLGLVDLLTYLEDDHQLERRLELFRQYVVRT